MKKRFFASIIAALLCAAVLCGCAERIEDVSVFPVGDTINSGHGSTSSASGGTTGSTPVYVYNPGGYYDSSDSSGSESSSSSDGGQSSSPAPQPVQPVQPVQSSEIIVDPDPEPDPDPIVYASLLENYRAKWGYNQLTTKQKKAYERLYIAAGDYDTSELDLSDLDMITDDLYLAYWAFDHDNPQFLELGSGYQMKYSKTGGRQVVAGVTIIFERSPVSVSQSKFDRIANEVIEEANTKATDYDKLLFIHDWIVDNTVYTYTDSAHEYEADGVVVYGEAVCEGYAKAFMYFAQSVGIDCVCVIGKAKGEQHMWNLVKLYGCWYNVDATWDDPKMSDGSDVLRHTYFLLSDADIGETHTVQEIFTLPSAPNTYV